VTTGRERDRTVLHVDADAGAAREVANALEGAAGGVTVETETTASDAVARLADSARAVDCLVVASGEFDGLDCLRTVRDRHPELPVVVLGDAATDPDDALAAGATEFCRRGEALAHPSLLARRVERTTAPSPDSVAELREKAAQLDAVFSELPLSLYIKDEEARHLRVSRGHATGYDESTAPEPKEGERIDGPSDFVGKTDLDLLPEANAREPYEDDLRVIETGEPIYNKEEHIQREDGDDLWVTTTKVPWQDDDGETKGLIGFSLAITERKEYERTLEAQTEELELLNRLLRHDVAHEVSIVNQRATLLAECVSDPDAQADLDAIRRSGERVAELLDTVRALVGAMLGDQPTVEAVPLAPSLRSELGRVRSIHDDARIEGPETLPEVRVRANEMLGELFRNLLTNAVYHNDTDRPTVEVGVETDDEAVVVRVADDGPGVPDSQKEAVFGRGEKGLESPGTGIGLYLVDTIVDMYDGEVWVEDNDPRGTVVCVRLARVE